MSDRDIYLSTGSDWAYLLSALLFVVGTTGLCGLIWLVIHAPLIHRRGRAYRRRLRAARHAQPHRLVRSPR
jgi:hypothetical protein